MVKSAGKRAWDVVKRGNMFILAIGLLLGLAFNDVVTSLANDVIMHPIAKAFGFGELKKMEAYGMLIGKFFAALLTFFIVSIVVFFLLWFTYIVIAYRDKRREAKNPKKEEAPKPSTNELILQEIRRLKAQLSEQSKN